MLRRSLWRWRRISYVTDVEGDFAYFQRFVCLSRVVAWEATAEGGAGVQNAGSSSAAASSVEPLGAPLQSVKPLAPPATTLHHSYDASYSHLVDLARYRLTFRDATSHFVFGGDAFDHGADLTFGRALLDFKRRFPARVHLLLGNRDVNKMAVYPRMALAVDGAAPDAAEDAIFTLPPPSPPTSASRGAASALLSAPVRYRDYLDEQHQQQRQSDAADAVTEKAPRRADRVSFLKWALRHKLGSPNAFAHRRHELCELQAMAAAAAAAGTATASPATAPTDAAVAQSFFAAAQPGGVYHDYIEAGVLSVVLDGVLFVHGGVNGHNAGFVPSLTAASYAEQCTAGEWWLPEVQPLGVAEGAEGGGGGAAAAGAAPTRASPSARPSALDWLAALEHFKAAAFQEWVGGTRRCGEALRAYVYPRFIAPHSIAVGTVMDVDGPHHVPLSVAAYLLESGIHTVCGGHQPIGDTPVMVRQPGGFAIVDADNSYCGRGNALCSEFNRRGAAVMELLFEHPDDTANGAGDAAARPAAPAGVDGAPRGTSSATSPSLTVHGYRADGAAFAFDLYGDLRVGRHVGEGWWVRLPPGAQTPPGAPHDGLYELRRTGDGFRTEEVRWATAAEVDAALRQAAAGGQAMVPGELPRRYTKEELAEVRVHRLKTKVSRPQN